MREAICGFIHRLVHTPPQLCGRPHVPGRPLVFSDPSLWRMQANGLFQLHLRPELALEVAKDLIELGDA